MRIDQLTTEQQAFVASVYAKCVEVGDCRIWTGKKTDTGYPRMSRRGRWFIVRREFAELKLGRKLEPREVASCKCGDPACLEWGHIRVVDIQQVRAEAGAAGKYSTPTKAIRLALAKRRSAKIDMETAREIRESSEASEVEAAKHGISPSMVRRIRANQKWRDYSSPFAGLGAR
jgi:hypothetical protein